MSSTQGAISFPITANEEQHAHHQAAVISKIAAAIASAATFIGYSNREDESKRGRQAGSINIKRVRRDVYQYIGDMDETFFRRKYRMSKDAFWTLFDIVSDHMPSTGEDRTRGAVPNGPITKAARLSMAIRYFADGDPLDISDIHGVSDDEVLTSVWIIVDSIHASKELDIHFPRTHAEQTEIMLQFKAKSSIQIDCCVGCIDGLLIWISKPTKRDQIEIGFGPTKFFCGRKMKYGLNMMGVCDARRRFTWVEVRFPGAASDFYAFDESHLKKTLEEKRFLRPGFCLFGDNAYVNAPYMCTPWRNVGSGPKDAMNFILLYASTLNVVLACWFIDGDC